MLRDLWIGAIRSWVIPSCHAMKEAFLCPWLTSRRARRTVSINSHLSYTYVVLLTSGRTFKEPKTWRHAQLVTVTWKRPRQLSPNFCEMEDMTIMYIFLEVFRSGEAHMSTRCFRILYRVAPFPRNWSFCQQILDSLSGTRFRGLSLVDVPCLHECAAPASFWKTCSWFRHHLVLWKVRIF